MGVRVTGHCKGKDRNKNMERELEDETRPGWGQELDQGEELRMTR